jgi:[NiFe] hydrogenase assembly HybE family chaperone
MTELDAVHAVALSAATVPADDGALSGHPAARLEAAYRTIRDERMRGVPILNPALDVAAVGFAPWQGRWLGVMVTPWFMNLMLVPLEPRSWTPLPLGGKRVYALPAGEYEFIGGADPILGEYQMCSLFSPMAEFADMATATLTARLALEAVLDPVHAEAAPGEAAQDTSPACRSDAPGAHDAPVSKRDFLRGVFLGRDDRR